MGGQPRPRDLAPCRTEDGQEVATSKVVVTAGAWSGLLAARLGIQLPLVASEHSYIVTEIIPGLEPGLPNLRVPDDAIYAKVQNQTLFLGAFEANPRFWEPVPGFPFGQFDLNMEAYLPYLEAFSRRLPMLEAVGHRSIICGPESFTPDGAPLFGETREVAGSASKSSIRRFVSTEKAPTRAFSWLKAATTAFTFKTLLRHYAKRALTPRSLNVKLCPRCKDHKGRAVWLA